MCLPTNISSPLCPSAWGHVHPTQRCGVLGTPPGSEGGAGGPLTAGQIQVGRKRPNVDFGHETGASPTLAPSPVRPHTRQAQETRWGPQEHHVPWFSEPSPSPAGTRGQVAPPSRARVSVLPHRDGEGVRVPRSEHPLGGPAKVTVISRQSGKPSKNGPQEP